MMLRRRIPPSSACAQSESTAEQIRLIVESCSLNGRCVDRGGTGGAPGAASPSSSIMESRASGGMVLLGVRGEGMPYYSTVATACNAVMR